MVAVMCTRAVMQLESKDGVQHVAAKAGSEDAPALLLCDSAY
jgi:hypothetical protein